MTHDVQLIREAMDTPETSPIDEYVEDMTSSLGDHLSDSDVEFPHYTAALTLDWLKAALRANPEWFGISEATA